MPPIVRRILVVAAEDGLVLQPLRQQQKPVSSLQIKYATQDITTIAVNDIKAATTLEAHGIIGEIEVVEKSDVLTFQGLLRTASASFLIALTEREQVAQIKGKAIYGVTGVALIPLASQLEAQRAIEQHTKLPKKAKSQPAADSPDDVTDDEGIHSGNVTADEDITENPHSSGDPQSPDQPEPQQESSSIAQDVIRRKGQYGRFAERWFSKKGWVSDKRRVSLSIRDKATEAGSKANAALSTKVSPEASKPQNSRVDGADESSLVPSLLPKLLRTTKMLLHSKSFFFSYDYDLTRRMGNEADTNGDLPLHKAVDPLFFWNRKLITPLIDAGQHGFVLPIMQGFVGQKAFTISTSPKDSKDSIAHVEENVGEVIELQETAAQRDSDTENDETRDFLVTLISRRSVERAGLRYLRRGVDEQGYVANAVETEQILSDLAWSPSFGMHSFTQMRGSIPLFFSQSPYSFKPLPTLQHSYDINHRAFTKHFSHLRERYGDVQVASLVERNGPEATVGECYTEHTEKLNNELPHGSSAIDYEWFDFHKICAGMKFEKVSLLMELLQLKLQSFGFTIEKDGKLLHQQSGILRTNCMDCLDRTNVVQSAAAAWALEAQLATEHVNLDLQHDASTHWFNALWADNGDAISKQYSSTAALKGDYTRTRKRDYRGAINDFGLTLTRYYNNIVNDYFSQTVIDYLLGNVSDSVFEEFEDKMMTADPGVSLSTIRQNAIDTSTKIVIADASEELVGGWTVSTPANSNTLRTLPLREIVLLMTDAALYAVRFDWNTEKVASFERVEVRSIMRARRGTYITSTFTTTQLDPQRNVGIVVTYHPTSQNLERHNTRSMSTKAVPRVNDGVSEERNKDANATTENVTASPGAIGNKGDSISGSETAAEPDDTELRSPPANESTQSPRPSLDATALLPNEQPKLLAFKMLPARSSRDPQRTAREGPSSEAEVLTEICAGLAKVLDIKGQKDSGIVVEEGDIIGVQEAKKSVGLLETLGHKVKKLVWA